MLRELCKYSLTHDVNILDIIWRIATINNYKIKLGYIASCAAS